MKKRFIGLMLCILLLFAAALPALAAGEAGVEDRIVSHAAPTDGADAAKRDEAWLREAFPNLRSCETTETRFVFASAPNVTKTRAVLNKKGESLVIYRFETAGALEKCKAMVRGNALVYGGKTVYADTLFSATYYYNDAEKTIALYCGAEEKVNNKLLSGYTVAGNFGGYFQDRNMVAFGDYVYLDAVKWDEGYVEPDSIKKVLALTDIVCIGSIKKAPPVPAKGKEPEFPAFGTYEIEVSRAVKGRARRMIKLQGYPGVMTEGRTYVLFLEEYQFPGGASALSLAESYYRSTFEIDDRGYVLPIREYGMKAPVKLEKFLKGL
ncbi:MAG TPA: hypothetical protein VN366_08845 [Feifaniaceae bacterium]|nr:hypothetical protein [Feifaniaceae bacterium]